MTITAMIIADDGHADDHIGDHVDDGHADDITAMMWMMVVLMTITAMMSSDHGHADDDNGIIHGGAS